MDGPAVPSTWRTSAASRSPRPRLDGDTTKIKALRTRLLDLPDWISTLWLTDRHEPEGDFTASQYKAHFKQYFDAIKGLPRRTSARGSSAARC